MTEDLKELGRFSCGFAKKKVKGRIYVYFWHYDGSGNKREEYIGRDGSLETQRKMLLTEITFIQSLRVEVDKRIQELKARLEALPANTPTEEKTQ